MSEAVPATTPAAPVPPSANPATPEAPMFKIPPSANTSLGPLAQLVLPRIFKLYDCTGGAADFEVYHKDATFEDPLMRANGIKQIKSAFYSMHVFSEAGIKEYSVVETPTGEGTGKIVVDNVQHYKVFGKEFDMVSRINLELEGGLITSHQDLWDRKPLSSGWAVEGCRRSGMFVTHLLMGFGRDLKPRAP